MSLGSFIYEQTKALKNAPSGLGRKRGAALPLSRHFHAFGLALSIKTTEIFNRSQITRFGTEAL